MELAAIGAFLGLFVAFVVLPTRIIERRRQEGAEERGSDRSPRDAHRP